MNQPGPFLHAALPGDHHVWQPVANADECRMWAQRLGPFLPDATWDVTDSTGGEPVLAAGDGIASQDARASATAITPPVDETTNP